jgi:hypothetical protein
LQALSSSSGAACADVGLLPPAHRYSLSVSSQWHVCISASQGKGKESSREQQIFCRVKGKYEKIKIRIFSGPALDAAEHLRDIGRYRAFTCDLASAAAQFQRTRELREPAAPKTHTIVPT